MAATLPILPLVHPVLLAAVIILVSLPHLKGTAGSGGRHSSMRRQSKQSSTRRQSSMRRQRRQSMPGQSVLSDARGRQKLGTLESHRCRSHTCKAAETEL